MWEKKLISGAAVLAAMLVSGVGWADDFKLKVLSAPGATYTDALGISNAGIIVGTYLVPSSAVPNTSKKRSYTYDTRLKSPKFTPFNMPAAHGGKVTETVIAEISPRGDIVGNYTELVSGTRTTYGFLYSGGTFTSIEFPGSTQTQATAIASQGGTVAGTYSVHGDSAGRAFVYHLGAYREIKSAGLMAPHSLPKPLTVNNSGFVTGTYHWSGRDENRSFTTTGQVANDFHPFKDQDCFIQDANPTGNILVGFCQATGADPFIPLYMSGGAISPVSVPGATSTRLDAVNVNGLIAGVASNGKSTQIFSWRGSAEVATTTAPAAWHNILIVGVNAAGKIAGRFLQTGDGRTRAFWAH